ncbi:MAG TPA: TonB-dependent receptor [Bacteroidia bacterium]|nr:TonB-dependent receptor [Bacteroidia bacterium]
MAYFDIVKKIKKSGLLLFAGIFLFTSSLLAQRSTLSGTVTDSTGHNRIFGAMLLLTRVQDSTIAGGGSTDSTGHFVITNVAPGRYSLKCQYTGYKPNTRMINMPDSSIDLGRIRLTASGHMLKEIEVIGGAQVRVAQNGDTTTYNANGFKTNPDANAEDLVNKMPGVTNDGTGIKVHGEDVKQVLVNGKPYFGDDPNAAMKNIPADMVDQVQIYDKASDNSQFTGFDDGQSKKTINIITKSQNGTFGKVYAGYGTNDRYNAGAALNFLHGDRRLTLLGMSNNINQQNFSLSDISGAVGSTRGSGRGGYVRPGSAAAGFMVGQQDGISTTNSFGLNYSDKWGSKMQVSGSYFFNVTDNSNNSDLTRNYYTGSDSIFQYRETNTAATRNINHRFNFRFEYTIDSMNALIIAPRLTYQYTDYAKNIDGSNLDALLSSISSTMSNVSSLNTAWNAGGSVTYRHRFAKAGRTLTTSLNTTWNNRLGTGTNYSQSYYSAIDSSGIDQHSSLFSNGYTLSPSLSWTEPAGKKGQMLFSYSPSFSTGMQDKSTNNFDVASADYILLDSSLSNKYAYTYNTQRGGVTYKWAGEKLMIAFGADYQNAMLSGSQSFPPAGSISRSFNSILPDGQLNYKFSKGTNLRIHYRTSNDAPSVSQLQEVVDNSNPLQLKTGNSILRQDYQHMLIAHYGKTNFDKATGFFVFFYGVLTNNYIANSTYIAEADTTLPGGILLKRGSQLSKPINLNGYKNARLFFTYSLPLTKIKSNLGLTLSGGFTSTPSKINQQLNISNTYNVGPGLTLSSNISEKVDFTIAYNGSYNIVNNSYSTQSDNNYFSHTASARFNWMFYKGFVFNTTLDQTFYYGIGNYSTNFLLWNASLGYKFLKDKSLDVRVNAFDILKQNTSVARTVTDTYIEDSRSNTLTQYFMLTVTWNIRHMDAPKKDGQDNSQDQQNQNGGGGNGQHQHQHQGGQK